MSYRTVYIKNETAASCQGKEYLVLFCQEKDKPVGEVKARLLGVTKRLWQEENGQSLVEYGLLLGLILLTCATIIGYIGTTVKKLYPTNF